MMIAFENSYARLPERLFVRLEPSEPLAPRLIRLNLALAERLGIDADTLSSETGVAMLAGAAAPKGTEPLAMAYAGHQFGNWVPQLGDGRAMLLGEIIAPDGARFDLHLKGSGRTPFSRGGDGKAVLGAVLREYIVSEAMAALDIPTTRALSVVTTGEIVMRDNPEPGAVLARVAASHIRVGTFQYLYARKDTEGLQALLDHVITRHYPEATKAEIPALAVLDLVMARQAELVAAWMSVGFIHGVMNTDNMAISGETIDYGPCAFMDNYDSLKVFSSIDHQGRYAFVNQPRIAHWNLAQFAQAMLPLIAADEETAVKLAQAQLDRFESLFVAAYNRRFCAKIGVKADEAAAEAVATLLALMEQDEVDFTLAFRRLTSGLDVDDFAPLSAMFKDTAALAGWLDGWQNIRGDTDAALALMKAANPVYIARNHRVEQAINAAYQGDFSVFETLLTVLEKPFADREAFAAFETPPRPEERVCMTFCGT
ncbi:MAG: YdiU family protein [Rhodobacteraceae bacterium]|nr:YdiU family protein [Paracoccaceae bacterium]